MKVFGKVHKLASMIHEATENADTTIALALRNALPTEKLTRDKRGRFTPLVIARGMEKRRDSIETLADVFIARHFA